MRQMGAKFKRDIEKIEDEDEYFDALPETCMQSANEHEYYSNFVLSDMTIEVIRAVKVKVITDHLVSLPKKVVNLVMYWAIENILNEDESNIYNDISIEAGQSGRLWSEREDQLYEQTAKDYWVKGQAQRAI